MAHLKVGEENGSPIHIYYEDRGSGTPDEGREMDEEMKFRFRQKDTWRILSRKIE